MERCQNCRAEMKELIWVPDFEYWGCPSCAAEAAIGADEPEILCPSLRRVLESARTVGELVNRTTAHVACCPECNPMMKRRAA